VIEQTPLQLYCCALILAPEKSILRGAFDNSILSWIQRKPKVQAHWNALLQTLEGHSATVNSVAFSLDGTRVVCGSRDKTVQLWDAGTGALLQTLEGHSARVHSVAFSPDGTRVVSGSCDQTVRLWDAGTGALLQTLEGHSDRVNLQLRDKEKGPSSYKSAFSRVSLFLNTHQNGEYVNTTACPWGDITKYFPGEGINSRDERQDPRDETSRPQYPIYYGTAKSLSQGL
jgi:WD40 repeat protein